MIYRGLLVLREGKDHIWLRQRRLVSLEETTYGGLWQRWGSNSAMDQKFLSPQNSYVATLTPNGMVLEVGAFGRWLGHEGRTLMNGVRTLIRRGRRAGLFFFHHVRTQQEELPGREPSPDNEWLAPWSWTSWPPELWEIHFIVDKHPWWQYFVIAAQAKIDGVSGKRT